MIANVRANRSKGLNELSSIAEAHDGWAVIVGGGPSMADHLDEINLRQSCGHTIFAMNGACAKLNWHGITPDYQTFLDARPHNVKLINQAKGYLVASQVDPSVVDAIHGPITLFHPYLDDLVEGDKEAVLIGGGTTSGLTIMALAYAMGFRNIALYGYDSSEREGKIHAYEQAETEVESRRIEAVAGGKHFVTSLVMYKQAELFPDFAYGMAELGCTIHVHGDGLLPTIAKEMSNDCL